jgi:hypothetical protein
LGCKKKFKLVTFESRKAGFKIDYPAGWIVSDQYAGVDMLAALFVAPEEKDNDIFTESINLTIQDLNKKFEILEYEKQIKNIMQAYTRIALDKYRINGGYFNRLIYTGAQNDRFQVNDQIYYVKNNRLYIFTYTSVPDSYERYKDLFEACVDSFKLNKE